MLAEWMHGSSGTLATLLFSSYMVVKHLIYKFNMTSTDVVTSERESQNRNRPLVASAYY